MSTQALAIVIFSALMHSTYNFLYKLSKNKIIYLWSMFSVAIVIMTLFGIFGDGVTILPNTRTILLAALAAVFFTMYQIFTGKAYALAEGDLSVAYPLSITAPLYIPFLAYILIGERISPRVYAGIVLALVGSYLLQQKSTLRRLRLGKVDLRKRHIRYAAFAGFIYSFGAIVDKVGVGKHAFFTYTYWVVIFMFCYMSANILIRKNLRSAIFTCHRDSLPLVLLGGAILTLSFLSYRFALQLASVSSVAGARQISSLFGVLMGIFILKEPYGSIRFVATLFIVAGIMLIKAG